MSSSTFRQPSARRLASLATVAAIVGACAAAGTPSASRLGATTAPTAAPTLATTDPTPTETPHMGDDTGASPEPAAPSIDAWLAVGRPGQAGLDLILTGDGQTILQLPDGVPDDHWGSIIYTRRQGADTVVADEPVQGGMGNAEGRVLPGAWRLPTVGLDPAPVGVSTDRHTVVLVDATAGASSGATGAAAPTRTRFAILSPWPSAREARIVTLDGRFDYDALASDGSVLYVIEHLAGPPAEHYQVRAIDVATGTLRPGVVVDKAETGEAMAGYPIARADRTDGMVLTLYRGAEHPFVHALQSTDAWAQCIDLPATRHDDAAAAGDWALVTGPDGRTAFAVDATLGLAVRIDADLSIGATTSFEPLASRAITLTKFGHQVTGPVGRRAVLAPDGRSLYAAGRGGIVQLATDDLHVVRLELDGQAVDAVAVTPAGDALYALLHDGGRIVHIDPWTGAVDATVPGDGYDRLAAIANF